MDTKTLQHAYDALLAADPRAVPPPGEWGTEQILAHVSLVSAATKVPALLLSNGNCLVDQPLSLGDILAGLADAELPGHTEQL